jgi:hypothetical protein
MNIIEEKYTWKESSKFVIRQETNFIVVHHAAAMSCTAQDIHGWHRQKGWTGIGYHFFVNKKGEIYRGRPVEVEGSHTLGFNSQSIGVCFEGNFEQEVMDSKEQIASGVELIQSLFNQYKKVRVISHKGLTSTDCPGKNFDISILGVIKKVSFRYKDDEKISDWAKEAIYKLKEKGIMIGDEEGNFNPKDIITREEVAKVIAKLINLI